MRELAQHTAFVPVPAGRLAHLTTELRSRLPAAFCAFVDAAGTATARATYYNTRQEQQRANEAIHAALFDVDRGVYTASLLLPGVTDYTRQTGVVTLLTWQHDGPSMLSPEEEGEVVSRVCQELPPQRMLKMFETIRKATVNNSRTRKLILRSILGSERLSGWSVKYRRKLATGLRHAWGQRTTGTIRSILGKPEGEHDEKEKKIVARWIDKFAPPDANRLHVYECVRFILGDETNLTDKRFQAYRDAKEDLEKGKILPYEVLEGIRSRYHPDVPNARVLELTKSQLTVGQQMTFQRKAAAADVKVAFNPANYDPVRLYLYAFEMGMTDAIRDELKRKAEVFAGRMPVRFGKIGVLIDASDSMRGHETQPLRPMAAVLAIRDLLDAASDECVAVTANGTGAPALESVPPQGDTSLAAALVALLKASPEIVFVLSDGYENAPAGRMAEVLHAARGMGITTPVYHFSPVFASESAGVRQMGEEIPAMPINRPEAIGLGVLKALFEVDVDRGVTALMRVAVPRLLSDSSPQAIEG